MVTKDRAHSKNGIEALEYFSGESESQLVHVSGCLPRHAQEYVL